MWTPTGNGYEFRREVAGSLTLINFTAPWPVENRRYKFSCHTEDKNGASVHNVPFISGVRPDGEVFVLHQCESNWENPVFRRMDILLLYDTQPRVLCIKLEKY